MKNLVLVTGANGFIGRRLCQSLEERGYAIRAAVRELSRATGLPKTIAVAAVGAIGKDTDWSDALRGVDTVVHLAARVHVLREKARNPLAEYRLVNVVGTERLARMAVSAGVRRLVYMSSIKVNGERTHASAFTETDAPEPQDAYGLSKWEAEQALSRIASETGLEVVIVRPPLVYGPDAGGNFLRMMDWLNRGIPLPLGSIRNSRSLIYLGNLVSALISCAAHARAAGRIFLVSDGEDVSTPELIRRLARAMERRPCLVPFPPTLLRFAGLLTGKSAEVDRLLGSLRIDSSKIRRELEWVPPFSMAQGLRETAVWYSGGTDRIPKTTVNT
jgi:nucleoside-diphosphate-sugar epimerase